MSGLAALRSELGDIECLEDPAMRRLMSRDFFWYSPVLKRQLDRVIADLVIVPRDEAEVVRVMRACHKHRVAVTPRGAGTGNYGQAMPVEGGIVLDLSRLSEIKEIGFGRVRAGTGAKIGAIDAAAQAHSRQELRMHPSTARTATIGGFVCGGSGGVGSITWGGLRDRGNILSLRLVTLEEEPRTLVLAGEDIQKAIHAYGTTGVVTEVEMPLAPAYPWVDVIVGFPDFLASAAFGNALAAQDALLKKLVTPVAAPIPELYFRQFSDVIPAGMSVVLVMVAPFAFDALSDLAAVWNGKILYRRGGEQASTHLPPLFELSWNHTTLQALKRDRTITYHQILYPPPRHLELVERMHRRFGEEVLSHLEFVRFDGQVACFGLPLIRFTTEERLAEITEIFEAEGCPTFSPHHFTLEEGGMKRVDQIQLAFKREADPLGLLNPGKMLAWRNPDYDASRQKVHLFAGAEPQS
jgi:FAD/FMN-containing dehydrogenase